MKKIIFKIIFFILIILLIAFSLILGLGFLKYKNAIQEVNIDNAISEIRSKDNYTNIENISKDFLDAIVAVEDHRFYEHKGIDIISIVHSTYVNLKRKSLDYGASTITQQVARNIYFTQEKSPIRKVAEIFIANRLEKNFSKNEILEIYTNIIYFGNGYYGIYDASYGYFNKAPKDLNFYESTYLAGLPNAPSIYSESEELAEQRRLQVINALEHKN
ncbi:MAG: transglycosylase domain-containing protein [Clostridia bacterium]|nr:transglycosylase domain-containing protein [Clostridia bacterium]